MCDRLLVTLILRSGNFERQANSFTQSSSHDYTNQDTSAMSLQEYAVKYLKFNFLMLQLTSLIFKKIKISIRENISALD
jgi:hypothetical protein